MVRKRNVTLKQVAELCGVTTQTASRILNSTQSHLYRKETRELIARTAHRLGYRPNTSAQTMRNGKFRCVSLLVSPEIQYSTFPQDTLFSIQQALAGLKHNLMFSVLPKDEDEAESELPRIFSENLVDGVLVGITHAIPEWLESLIRGIHVPIVWIGSKHECDCIHHDDFGSTYDMTLRLAKEGHTKIAYVDLAIPQNEIGFVHFSVYDRMNGYIKAMGEAGLKPRVVRPKTKIAAHETAKFASEHIVDGIRPTAVISYDIPFSGRPLLYSFGKKGIRIPEDVSFVAFSPGGIVENDMEIACFVPHRKIGETASQMLYDKIQKHGLEHKPVVLPFELIEGDTIAKERQENIQ